MRIKNPNPPAPVAAANGTGALLSLSTAQLRAGVEIDGEHYAYKYDLSLADMMRFQEAVAGADDDQAVASKAVDEAMKYCVDLPDEVRALLPPTYRAQIVGDWFARMAAAAEDSGPLATPPSGAQ